MRYFGSIVLVCILQWIQFSFACFGYGLEIVDLACAKNNNIKIEKGSYYVELTDDCKVHVHGYFTVDRPFEAAKITVKGSTSFMNATIYKDKDFCEMLSNVGCEVECPFTKSGRFYASLGKPFDISENYGPMLAFVFGEISAAVRLTFDGDEANPDLFGIVLNVTRKDNDYAWF